MSETLASSIKTLLKETFEGLEMKEAIILIQNRIQGFSGHSMV
ncbi:hypothetical protein [Peribacillus simplex]|nr:hypothetical protein [Peribacillus simplex]